MSLSFSATWDDAVKMLRANSGLLLAVAGVFLFLPTLLTDYLIPQPTPQRSSGSSIDPTFVPRFLQWMSGNAGWLILSGMVRAIGTIAILRLLLDRERVTVGAALVAGMGLLLSYYAAALLSGLIIMFATLALILPGLYAFGRLAPLGAVVVAETRRNPVDAIKRSFEITKGNGWAIVAFVLLVLLAGLVVSFALTVVIGSLLSLVAGDLGPLLVLILNAVLNAALGLTLITVYAAIYRRLAGAAGLSIKGS